jgi:hypothetical protein
MQKWENSFNLEVQWTEQKLKNKSMPKVNLGHLVIYNFIFEHITSIEIKLV